MRQQDIPNNLRIGNTNERRKQLLETRKSIIYEINNELNQRIFITVLKVVEKVTIYNHRFN